MLDRLFKEPDYRGCTFMNATAEAPEGSVEQLGAKGFRDWLNGLFLGLAREANVVDPVAVGQQLVILYDGAVVVAQMDSTREPGQIAKGIARSLMATDPAWQTADAANS